MYLEDRRLHLIKGITLIGHGPDLINGRSTVIHDIWKGTGPSGRTYAQRRLLELQRSDLLAKRLPKVTRDARTAFEAMRMNESSVINPSKTCFRIVITQGSRIVATDEIADNPELLHSLFLYTQILQFTNTLHLLAFPGISYLSPGYWKRRYGRRGLQKTVESIVNRRMARGAAGGDDTLHMLFIAGANTGVVSGSMLNIVAHHQDWQGKIYNEIKSSAAIYATDKTRKLPLVDQLDQLPIEAWEKMSESLELCYKEAIRMWVAFPMGRFNDTPDAISIPGSNQVIPPSSFAFYNTIDAHYNEKLYPNAIKWDPERWSEGRMESPTQGVKGCFGTYQLSPIY
ncbi:cytochrome P450 [Metarhizium robertsii]|nr:cytochrome P450 [Metarhizium robertsii]